MRSSLLIPCPVCGTEIADDAEVCTACGTKDPFDKSSSRQTQRKIVAFILLTAAFLMVLFWDRIFGG